MSRYSVEELYRQTYALPDDVSILFDEATAAAREAATSLHHVQRVVAVGSGDSYHAALSCAQAFRIGSATEYLPMSTVEFLYFLQHSQQNPRQVGILGLSASGNNPRLAQALNLAVRRGYPVISITGAADSPVAAAARHLLKVSVGDQAPSPGIRTYQATIVGLLCLARAIADQDDFFSPFDELAVLRTAVQRSIGLAQAATPILVETFASSATLTVAAAGPSLGTARHIAAKATESAALPASGVDIDDWWHVHRFGHDPHSPIAVVQTSAPCETISVLIDQIAQRRPMILLVADAHRDDTGHGHILAVAVKVAPAVQLLCDHVIAGLLAAGLAERRGTKPFANP